MDDHHAGAMSESGEGFEDAALVLAAHGSTLNAGSSLPAYQHADALRRRGWFAEVTEAFYLEEPPLAGALRRVFSPRVFVVPLFISDGWFADHVVPVELGLKAPDATTFERVQGRSSQVIHYCAAVGTHPGMGRVLVARAREVVARHPFPRPPLAAETALVVAGHGTNYGPGSRAAVEQQVELLRATGAYAEVHAVYLEEEPRVSQTWDLTPLRNVVVVPYFMSDGLHTQEDIPAMLGEPVSTIRERLASKQPTWRNPTERQGKRLWYAGAIGREPLVADVIVERVREMEGVARAAGE